MCDHEHNPQFSKSPKRIGMRLGSSLEHGEAHAQDHTQWSRRDFMTSMGLAAAGGAMVLGGAPVRAFGQTPLLAHLRTLETDRVLVLVQLSGGNDGLNNLVPITNDRYYNARPQIAIPSNQTLAIPGQSDLGFHPSFDAVTPLYSNGDMALLQNVGYPDPHLSHFDSTDVWLTASNSNDIGTTGWIGRYLGEEFPDFDEEPTNYPLAVQMGGTSALLFQGAATNMGMSLASPELFARIAEEGILYTVDGLPDTTFGREIEFVRTIANDSFIYAEAVQTSSEIGENKVEYPQGNGLAQNLSIVARLIKGRLGARIYHVSIGGFDTHANQGGMNGQHANLLRNLSEAVKVFLDDLDLDGWSEDVLVATFSEFGRRVNQNGSGGTDHGTAAPVFLYGAGVEGGLYGSLPNLTDLDETGNLQYEIDFRSVYATLLQDWFGLSAQTVESVLGGAFETLKFVSDPATPTAIEDEPVPESFTLHQNYPNPFNPTTNITYTLARTERVTLRIYDAQGRLVQTLLNGTQPAGSHAVPFNAGHLASGSYFYRLHTADGVQTRQMMLVR